MEYIACELDDDKAVKCGKCSNCQGKKLFEVDVTQKEFDEAKRFIKEDFNVIYARKQWPDRECYGTLSIRNDFRIQDGLVLSNYGDAGWGRSVSKDKYLNNHFGDDLVNASAELLDEFVKKNDIKCLTYIPSLRRPELVKNFAQRLANKMNLEYYTGLEKCKDVVCQKELNNSYKQWENVVESFAVKEIRRQNVLLVDDMVDSRWTFTVCGYKLLEEGNGKVFPFALANSAGKGE